MWMADCVDFLISSSWSVVIGMRVEDFISLVFHVLLLLGGCSCRLGSLGMGKTGGESFPEILDDCRTSWCGIGRHRTVAAF